MAHIYADRVMETTTTTGTGDITLGGAVTGFSSFASRLSTSDTFDYTIFAVDGDGVPTGAWETGVGTYLGSSQFSRSVAQSSSGDAAVNFAAGTKRVALALTGERVAAIDAGGSTPVIRASRIVSPWTTTTITVPWPTGTVEGDIVYLFAHNGNSPGIPSGWTTLHDGTAGSNTLGFTCCKIMTADDITAGSVNITVSSAFAGTAIAVTVEGSTQQALRGASGIRSNNGSLSMPYNFFQALAADLCLAFVGTRANVAITFPAGSTVLQSASATNASAAAAVVTPGRLGVAGFATVPSAGNGYITCAAASIGA